MVRYLGDSAAQLDLGDGRRALVESTLPLRTRDSSGETVPTDFELIDHGDDFAPRAPFVDVRLPKRLADGIDLPNIGVSLSPRAVGGSAGQRAGGSVFWGNAGGRDTDVLAMPLPWGFQVLGYLRSAESPEEFALNLKLPPGATAEKSTAAGELGQPSGGIIIKRHGDELARISPPIAYDADGAAVEAWYTLNGTTLTAHVSHRSAEPHYPVVLDPVVIENYQHWYTDGAMNANGWRGSYWTRDGVKFNYAFANGWSGRGLYMWEWEAAPTMYARGDQVWWELPVPGSTAYVYRADFNYIRTRDHNTCLNFGINRYSYWESQVTRCNGNLNYEHHVTCKAPDCSSSAGTEGNQAIFLDYMAWYDQVRDFSTMLGGAAVYFNDRYTPDTRVESRGHADVWLDDTTFRPELHGTDTGLGVKQFKLTVPGLDPLVRTHICQGDRSFRCPSQTLSSDSWIWVIDRYRLSFSGDSFAVNTATVPEGLNRVEARTADFAGNWSLPQTWTLKVDHSGPALNVAGLSDGQTVDYEAARVVDIGATDPYSGVKSIEVLVDDARQEITREQTCDAGGCPMNRTWLFLPAAYGPGAHKIEIQATDQIGHTSTRTYEVRVADPLGGGG